MSSPRMSKTFSRVTREELYFGVASLVGRRSSCPRAAVGAIAVNGGRIVATAYNGAVSGAPHCTDPGIGCDMEGDHCVRAVHAEANLVAYSARIGAQLSGTDVYLTHSPCLSCAKLLANSSVASVHIREAYGDDPRPKILLMNAGVLFHGD